MDAWHQLVAQVAVRHIGEQEGVADPPEIGHQEHHDDGVEGAFGDAGPGPCEGHDQHDTGEGEACKPGHDPHVCLSSFVNDPGVGAKVS